MIHQKKLIWRNGRAFCRYELWEDYQAGFYDKSSCMHKHKADESAVLLIDSMAFYASCIEVFRQWPITSLVHLTNININHKAWIGHAANFLHHKSCEDCTVRGWHMLNAYQQAEANKIADQAVMKWLQQCEQENCRQQSGQLALTF